MGCGVRKLVLWWCCAAVSLGAQQNKPQVIPAVRPPLQQPTDRKVPLLAGPIGLGDFASMEPRVGIAEQMTHVSGFMQESPNNGGKATETTEAWLGHTRTALYVVVACHDAHPGDIRRHLSRRENILTDDRVSLLLDTFQDRRRGVLFQVNALGIQADAAWTDGSQPDYSYDQVWNSDARVTPEGWMALIEIPFTSLRFRPGVQGWGVVLMRDLPRTSETDTWPAVSENIAGTLSQEGTLLGIEGVTGSHNLQLNPYGLLQNEHRLDDRDALAPTFSTRRLEGTAGGDAKAIVKDSIVIDATVNPDFRRWSRTSRSSR